MNPYKLKDYVGGVLEKETTQAGSHYKRLIRFFQNWGEQQKLLHNLMGPNLRFLQGLGFKTLVMDGTSWTRGEAKVHYWIQSVLVGSVAIPIYWVQLEKIGASSQAERKAMFEVALSLFDLKGLTLLADREYIGKEWFKFLKETKIHFVIRLRLGDYFEDMNAAKGKDYGQMQGKCALKNKLVKKPIGLDGVACTILILPNPKSHAEEPVMFFFNQATQRPKCHRTVRQTMENRMPIPASENQRLQPRRPQPQRPKQKPVDDGYRHNGLHTCRERRVETQKPYPDTAL